MRDKTPVIGVLAVGTHAEAHLGDWDSPSDSPMQGMTDVKIEMAGSSVLVAKVDKVGLSTHILEVSVDHLLNNVWVNFVRRVFCCTGPAK